MHNSDETLPSLAWLIIRGIGGALALTVIVGVLAGRALAPITPSLLLGAAALGGLPSLVEVLRGRWHARLAELLVVALTFGAVAGVGLWLAWPALLPLGRSVDAVHQFQLVQWLAQEQRLPPLDARTQGLMGEMIAYPVGFALVVNAAAGLVRLPVLDAMFPVVALLGGSCAALVALLSLQAGRGHGWRAMFGLAGVVLLLAHRAYFLDSYIDHSYYAQVLGLVFVLLACAYAVCAPRINAIDGLQVGLVLAALLASYPLWVPVPACVVGLALARQWTMDGGRWTTAHLMLAFVPPLALGLIDLPARLQTGQIVLEHQGVVTLPSVLSMVPVLLAIPAALLLWQRTEGEHGTSARFLALALGLAGLALACLVLAARLGLAAPYHSVKMLFVLMPLAAAVVGAGLIRLATIRPMGLRLVALGGAIVVLAFTSARFLAPIRAEQIPSRDLVAASRWLLANEPEAAMSAVVVGAPTGPMSYWLQVGMLGQWRDEAQAAMRAFTITPPTPEGWAVDAGMPEVAVAPTLGEAPPGSEVLARFGEAAVLQRAAFDVEVANPFVLRYDARWEEERLKTALELIRPIAGPLPLIEVLLVHDGSLVNRFSLPPDPERTKNQYLGADILPETLGGVGYVNAEAYPTFAPPASMPTGAFEVMLRLTQEEQVLDQRLLATFDRTANGAFANLALHSGEFDYVRRNYANEILEARNARFDSDVVLTGGTAYHEAGRDAVVALLRWQALSENRRLLSTEIRLLDAAGHVVVRDRSVPQHGFYPFWRWRNGEDVVERRELRLPPDFPPGTYTLAVAVYDDAAQTELPLTAGEAVLGQIVVQ